MLKILVKGAEFFNEKTGEFYNIPDTVLCLEHSLYAISKWECIHEKTFFNEVEQKTDEEMYSYIHCMCLNEDVDYLVIKSLSKQQIAEISEYMGQKMTARTSYKKNNKRPQYTTTEDIYYQMIMNGLPMECEHWHLNRLLALLKYFSIHSGAGGKMGKMEQASMYRDLNRQRKAALKTKG